MPSLTQAASVVAVVISLLASGCTSCKDVSHDQIYLGPSRIGQVYHLRSSVFYYNANAGRIFFDHYPCTPGHWLLPECDSSWERLPSVEDYSKTHRPHSIQGIVGAGTRISLSEVIFHD